MSETVNISKLVCIGSTYELGSVIRRAKKGNGMYVAMTYMVEGNWQFDTLKEAQDWVMRTCRNEFRKMKESP